MKKTYLVLALLLISANAFAHTVFVGTIKGTTIPCSLEIEQTYFENNIESAENFRADIHVSLESDGHGHLKHGEEFHFTVKPTNKAQILSGLAANQLDTINVLTAPGSQKLDAPVSFALKWMHINHYHTAQCLNLVLADHE